MPVILQYVPTSKSDKTNSKMINMTIDNNVVYISKTSEPGKCRGNLSLTKV